MVMQTLGAILNQLLGAFEGKVDVGTDILLAKEFVEAGFMEHSLYRGVHTREYHLDALTLRHEAEVREIVDARRVDKRHLTHSNDSHPWFEALMAQGTQDRKSVV